VIALLLRARITRDWVELDNAVVLDSRIEGSQLWMWLVIDYEYHSGDVHYVGSQGRWLPPFTPRNVAQRGAGRYRPGQLVSIFVNPDNHQRSVLEPTPPNWLIGLGVAIAIGAFWMGSVAI
jgi:hypothetical protein